MIHRYIHVYVFRYVPQIFLEQKKKKKAHRYIEWILLEYK